MSTERPFWAHKLDFILSTIGYAVGLGNIWRFPYLCYKSGGGAFLIPYFIMLIFCGVPLMIMETAVGQLTRQGPVGALAKICPLFMGAGVGVVVMAFIFCLYYNVVIAWSVYYLFVSLSWAASGELPWASCEHYWNNQTSCWDNFTATAPNNTQPPTQQFFTNQVLQKSEGLEDAGGFNLHLLACLAVSWVLVYLALFRGIRWTGKLVYFTALFPYVILISLLVLGATLPGAEDGVIFFVKPRWERLKDYQVWVDAAIQNFNSIGIAFGSLIAFSSYNSKNNNIIRDCLIVSSVNALTSLLSGFVIFSVLGFMAHIQHEKIEKVVDKGPGLLFVSYPAAFAELPAPHFWAIAFFFMLILLGIDSQFATFEVILTTVEDSFGRQLKPIRREFKVLFICAFSFLLGLPLVTKAGIYIFELLNIYSSGISLMYLAFFECIAVVWFYGANNLIKNLKDMTGLYQRRFRCPFHFLFICLVAIAPALILVMWVFVWKGYKQPVVGSYEYPGWSIALGWLIAMLSVLPIPIFMVWVLYKAPGATCLQKLKHSIRSPLLQSGDEKKSEIFPEYINESPRDLAMNALPPMEYTQVPNSPSEMQAKRFRIATDV